MSELDGGVHHPPVCHVRGGSNERILWWSDAFAAGGATLGGVGLLVLGLDISQNWATVLVGGTSPSPTWSSRSYRRAVVAACTTVVALGTPTFVALVVFPVHTYNGFRVFELATIALWFAFFAIGSTRPDGAARAGRHVHVVVRDTRSRPCAADREVPRSVPCRGLVTPSVGRQRAVSAASTRAGNMTCTNNGVQETFGDAGAPSGGPKSPTDYSLGIGLESLAFGLAFLCGVRDGERNNRVAS